MTLPSSFWADVFGEDIESHSTLSKKYSNLSYREGLFSWNDLDELWGVEKESNTMLIVDLDRDQSPTETIHQPKLESLIDRVSWTFT